MMAFMFANAIAPAVVAEGAVAMTAAEILAAEAAAAHAAQVLAAQTLAAEQAAATAATASTASNAGIMGAEIGASVAPATETAAAGLETVAGAESANAAQLAQQQAEIARQGFSQAELEALQRGQEMARLSSAAPPAEVTAYASPNATPTSMLDSAGTTRAVTPVEAGVPSVSAPPDASSAALDTSDMAMRSGNLDPNAGGRVYDSMMQPDRYGITSAGPNIPNSAAYNLPSPANMGGEGMKLGGSNIGMSGSFPQPAAPSGLEAGFNKALQFAKDSPFSAGSMALNAVQYLGKKEKEDETPSEYNGILTKYKMSPDFKGRSADPQDYQYTPKVYNMASGGIASYKRGELVGKSSMDYYERMTKPAEKLDRGDAGIYYDLDPDTRYQDALTAAQIRQAKVAKRANMQLPGMKRPTPMGQLNMVPVTMKAESSTPDTTEAAQGGVIHPKRYADGGVTGSGNLDLHIPLNLGGEGYGGGNGGGATYPFQNNGRFAGNNNAPQVTSNPSLVADQAQRMQPYQASSTPGLGAPQGPFPFIERPEPQDLSSMKGTTFGGNPQQGMSQLMGLLGRQKMAGGGITSLGGYAAGGNPRLLKGPGDGMSDNIPATIAGKQPARLADGEFVIPADVVSHLGNGSTEAGAKKLHKMMNDVRKARTGNPKQGKQINPNKFMPK